MARTPFNPKIGRIRTDAGNESADRAFLAHYHIAAADAVAESDTGVMALTALGAEAASVTSGFNVIATPRNVKIDGSAANMTGNVKVYGTRAGKAISETIALDGTTAKPGNYAFDAVTKVDLPARTNTPAKQKATVAVTQGALAAGSTVFTFVSVQTGAAFDVPVAFLVGDDTTAEAAVKLAAGLNANATFSAKWLAASADANVTIESKTYAAQDADINLTVKTAGDSAITLGAITVDTVSGVAEDKVSVGWGKKFGIPYKLSADELVIVKLFNASADAGTVTPDATDLHKNVIALNGTPDGSKDIDLYIIV